MGNHSISAQFLGHKKAFIIEKGWQPLPQMVRPEIQAILRPATSTEYTKLQYFQALVG
jgi:hypothetical protein